MSTTTVSQIFVNLPVKDFAVSRRFFESLGFSFNPQFTNETAGCLVLGPGIHAMLLSQGFFATFTPHPIADATKATEVITALQLASREQVDAIVRLAVAAGGATNAEPKDHGFMYQHGFTDPDGHIWEVFFMSAPPPAA